MLTMTYICSSCGARAATDTMAEKCTCGGLWDLDFTPPAFDLSLIDHDVWGLFRYRRFLPLTDGTWRGLSLGEGMTPIIPFDDNLQIKMDFMMPTLSFKDRGAAVLISHAKSIGIASVVQDSSGNAGNSVAAYCGRAGIDCTIYVPEGTSPKKISMIESHGAAVNIVPGSRDNCADVCRAAVTEGGAYYANHVYNPFFYQGTKTYIYEIYEQLGRIPETLFVPVGNGTLFIGIVKGLEELLAAKVIDKMPKIIAVQSGHCAPLALAASEGKLTPAAVNPTPTIAEGIAIGKPMRGGQMLEMAAKYGIEFFSASEDKILDARNALAKKGIYCEHTSAIVYSAYLEYTALHGAINDCLIPLTGAGLKSDH